MTGAHNVAGARVTDAVLTTAIAASFGLMINNAALTTKTAFRD